MKIRNKRGFAVVEGLLIVIALSLIGGIGYYVYAVNKETGTQQAESSIQKQVKKKEEQKLKMADLIDYGQDGVRITKTSDIDKLQGAGGSFKSFISGQTSEKEEINEECGQPSYIVVNKIYKDEFANGGMGDCAGAAAIWKKENGTWKRIWGGQTVLPCEEANKYKIPSQISEECQDEKVEANHGIVKNLN